MQRISRRRTQARQWVALLVGSLVMVAGCNETASADRNPSLSDLPLAQRVGWLDEKCFAISNATLAKGTPVTIVTLDGEPTIVRAQVQLVAQQARRCAMTHARSQRDASEAQLAFYELRLPQGTDMTLGIGIVGNTVNQLVTRGVESGLDVNGDGMPENFTSCTTSNGVAFGVWERAPYRGVALWKGSYSLGVATEPNCPNAID